MSLLDELALLPTAALLGALATSDTPDPAVVRLTRGDTTGPAVTCRCPPADNLTVIHAIEACEPGEVLVVETDASVEVALFGGLLATWAVEKGLAGVVTNGYVRDAAELHALGLPVWCRGVRLAGPARATLGEVGVPIRLGSLRVAPGDLVRADEDGVVAVPRARAREVLDRAQAKEEDEARVAARLRDGESLLDALGIRQAAPARPRRVASTRPPASTISSARDGSGSAL